jgi:uncharacterized membrane protein
MRQILWLLLFLPLAIQAQSHISGVVKDSQTKKGLPFASVVSSDGTYTISDVDGKFSLDSKNTITSFSVTYVGYTKQSITVNNKNFHTILLTAQSDELHEVKVSNENPALAIIREVVRKKGANNPEKKLNSFEFKSYSKLIITANPDSIDGRIDTVWVRKNGAKSVKLDSSDYRFKKIIAKQHLFQTEQVSLFQYGKNTLKETILATRMAGFREPLYELITVNLQSFSVYDNRYELFETQYNSPISDFSYNNYRFKLLDSIDIGGRKTFMIYFKNKRKSKAAGLEGVLYIDSRNFAVAKAVMRIRGVLDISAVHEFEYLADKDLWFPTYNNFKITKGKKERDIRILGETLKFDADDTPQNRKKVASDFTYAESQSYHFDKKYNLPEDIKNHHIGIEVTDDAANKPEAYWNQFRKDSLDVRSRKTYHVLDSLAQNRKIEKRLLSGRKILNGYVPFGFFDLDLRYLLSYNNYEGFRVGLGGKTNERFSKKFRIDGYTTYGTKDGEFKHSLGFAARTDKYSNSWVGASFTDDIREIGSTSFAIDKRIFKLYDPRPINVSTFYGYQSWRLYFETKAIPKTESIWQLNYSHIQPQFDYVFVNNGISYRNFDMATAQVSIQWNPFSSYLQTPDDRIESEKHFPKFTFQYTQAVPKLLGNDFNFGKIDFRTVYEKKYINGQKSAFLLEAGYAFGDVPLTHLYNTSPNNLTKDKVIQRITFAGKNSFETMYFNEFFSNKYAMFQVKHGFKRIKIAQKIRPSFVMVSRAVWGNMDHPEKHMGFNYKTLEKGFYESGIELNQIYSGFGLTAFYRYGPYQLSSFEDNLAIKLSFVLDLGL